MEAFRSSLDLVTLDLVADPVFEALFGEHCALLLTSLEFPMLWRCNRQHTALPFPPSGVYTTYAHFGDLYEYWSRNITKFVQWEKFYISADQVDDENGNHLFWENQMKRDNYVSRKLKFSIMARYKDNNVMHLDTEESCCFKHIFLAQKYQDTIC